MAGGLCSAIFVARCHAGEASLLERIDRLVEFYAPLNIERVWVTRLSHLSLVVGEVCFAPPGRTPARTRPRTEPEDAVDAFLLWGGPAPTWLSRDRLLTANDAELRWLDRTVAAFAADQTRARLVTGCAGATALFTAGSAEVEAWSSHAVAASYLALGAASIDPATLPEFFAAEFVGAGRTHLRGVTEVAAASDIEFSERRATRRFYWPAPGRFARLPESAARVAAEAALLESLEARLATAGDLELGLTAGADSRVSAVALHELGIDFQAVTIAPGREDPDARGAASVAEALDVPHRLYGYELVPDSEAVSLIDAEVRWSEGLAPLNGLGWAESHRPATVVTGGGGETARAWYYRWQARNYRNPSPRQLLRVLRHLHWQIEEATADAHQQLDGAISGWLEAAAETGHAGWRMLDVVYENERLRRWGRGRLPRVPASFVYAFSSPELTRALISLPLDDRISDGFHRGFVAKYAPDLALDSPSTQRRGIPPALRRLKTRLRHQQGLDPGARSPWFFNEVWRDRPLNRRFIADEALSRELLSSAMGAAWVERIRAGFVAGEAHATETALHATSIAALDLALEQLR